jgi:hypothetical protein
LGEEVDSANSLFRSDCTGGWIVIELQESFNTATIEEIKEEWRHLWRERIDDKVRAEGVASQSFPLCFVDQGTIIVATRDFKPLHLKEILSLNRIQNAGQIIGPAPAVGGWHKFARTVLNKQPRKCRFVFEKPKPHRAKKLQLKNGGRGWLNRSL